MHSPSTHLHVYIQHDDAAKHLGGVVPGQLHVLCHILLADVLSKLGLQGGAGSQSFSREAAQQGTADLSVQMGVMGCWQACAGIMCVCRWPATTSQLGTVVALSQLA